jgi:hypothetical protein
MIRNLILGLFLALLATGCEEPPEVKSPRPTTPNIPLVQTTPTPEGVEDKKPLINASGRISFNQDAASAMAKVKEMIAQRNGGSTGTNNQTTYQTPNPAIVPPEIKEALEDAKDNKAINDSINAVLADLPEAGASQPEQSVSTERSPEPAQNENDSLSVNLGNQEGTFAAGVRVPSQVDSSKTTGANGSAKQTPSPTPTDLNFIKNSMPRGYLLLCMANPSARDTVEILVQNLIDAKIEHVFLGLLTDGTFGTDFEYVKSVLTRLSQAGRVVTLATYVTNGPTMRYFNKTPITAGFARTDPRKFRRLIIFDDGTRAKYKSLAKNAAELLRHNHALNPKNKNIAIPMLEDNLNKESYLAIRSLMKEALLGIPFTIVRSPCLGCYAGNDAYTPGDPIDDHGESAFSRVQIGGAFSFDGAQFHYPNETATGTTFEGAKSLIIESERRQLLFFGLWRLFWQGLNKGSGIHPDDREYIPPTPQELTWNIELLRTGLE